MKQKIRKSVFETNSSTQHTLTIQRQIDPQNDLNSHKGRIPSNTTFEFSNSMVEDIESPNLRWNYDEENSLVSFTTEVDKLALCVAFCRNSYDNIQQKESGQYFWDYTIEMEDEDGNEVKSLNDVVKDKPFFKELIQAVKEERNTDLVLVDGLYELDSLNDDCAYETLLHNYVEETGRKFSEENESDLVEFFKTIIFGNYTIFDKLFPC